MDDIKLRLRFTKTGRAVYISHLDLMRTMQRAFMRAEIPLKYSEGFNPHALISIALPLPVGMESVCELMDFRLNSFMNIPEISYRLNRCLPEGIVALEAYEWERKCKEIRWLDVEGRLEYGAEDMEEKLGGVVEFFEKDSIVIEKKSKSGPMRTDIAPAIRSLSFDAEEKRLMLRATVSAQEPTLNPELLVSALRQLSPALSPEFAVFRRVNVYDVDMKEFR